MRFLVKKEKEKISRKFDLCIVSFIVSSTSLIAISFVIYKINRENKREEISGEERRIVREFPTRNE